MNKIVAVTGAGRGLGCSLVKKHIETRDKIYAFDYAVTDELKALAAKYESLKYYKCDISKDQEVRDSTREMLASESRVDLIYNVAGIFSEAERVGVAETDLEACMRTYNINALGALRICKNLWPLIQKGSIVVNISSESGSVGAARRKSEYGYGMSKAAMNMFGKLLSNELWETGARVMNFHPGWLRTVMGGDAAFKSDRSVDPDVSAADITGIICNIDKIPRDQMYMDHKGVIIPW
jgi:NAD(P)-dependent dehydrogenase (short-subunit alcohol dehydrogenase family)